MKGSGKRREHPVAGANAPISKATLSEGNGQSNVAPPATLSPPQRIKFQWKVIRGIDSNIFATNAKATMLLTFNTFVFGTIVLQWREVGQFFGPFEAAILIANVLLFVAALAALLSLWFALHAVVPVFKPAKEPKRYHSLVFFGDVARQPQAGNYVGAVRESTPESLADDLAKQAHALAKIACSKFWWLDGATRLIAFVQLPAFLGMILTLLISAFCR
jgi:pycsar effector protein